ncbi:carboxylating nicotinate-nucleotide diphosphorylase [Polyangium mundeleinium]|uniref:nicotinate-nucleotide diphosphorylase (carboxylating) n=1 Tax=Polyangium mundeleinium TaxID=2995306 RepID=A0ABT5ENP6_9BACT|nr:carboxylating nicotinate-nucleotide diphosphorylase [Polyangium mundeleinium]MDC0743431.1 carboxylating nicotinate-nucleotide diphosphorylase [Polyangium mundeleinium]
MIAPPLLDAIVDRALEEDLAGGDLSGEACVDAETQADAAAVARKAVIACGAEVFRRVFTRVDPRCVVETLVPDGKEAPAGTTLWRVRGPARAVLASERTALNLVQRMTGIATVTRRYVDAVPKGARTRITDTRKTTPGLRVLERYAVRMGGGINHRNDLGSAVMIKDNHIVAAGGISRAVERARAHAPHTSRIEVEVDSLVQLEEAIAAGADVILLDNFSTEDVARAVARAKDLSPRPILEASGGITLERITELALAGVDVISVGALTHSAPAADIGLDFQL